MRIVNVIARLGLAPAGQVLMIGLALSDGRIAWGQSGPLTAGAATAALVAKSVTPILKGQPIERAVELAAELDGLRQEVATTRTLPAPPAPPGVSRRQFLTGTLASEPAGPQLETIVEKQPLPAPLRLGLSQALLNALAMSRNMSLPALLADLYDLRPPEATPQLLVAAGEANIETVRPVMAAAVAAVGYSTSPSDHKLTLGKNGERLQAHVRQVKKWLTAADPAAKIRIYLDIQGGYSELYDNNEGKILGALYGLEQAAKPYQLIVENAVKGPAPVVTAVYGQLKSYLSIRRMSTRLAAGGSQYPPAALAEFVRAGAVHQVRPWLSQLGSLDEILRFLADCRAQSVAVSLHDDGLDPALPAAVGLAAGVWSLSGPPAALYNAVRQLTAGGE